MTTFLILAYARNLSLGGLPFALENHSLKFVEVHSRSCTYVHLVIKKQCTSHL